MGFNSGFKGLTHERTTHAYVRVENNNRVIQHRIMKFWISLVISKYFSLTVQTGCGVHPASFQWLLWVLCLRVQWHTGQADRLHPSSAFVSVTFITLLNFLKQVSVHFKFTALFHIQRQLPHVSAISCSHLRGVHITECSSNKTTPQQITGLALTNLIGTEDVWTQKSQLHNVYILPRALLVRVSTML